jgi:hypothetical protein
VCDDCNQYFGDNLENFLARDTYEGLLRFTEDTRSTTSYRNLGIRSTISFRINEGIYKNSLAYLEPNEQSEVLELHPLPQIGFKLKNAFEYDFYLMSAFPTRDEFNFAKYDLQNSKAFMILGIDIESASEKLSSIGLAFYQNSSEKSPFIQGGTLEVEVTSHITETIQRCISKIAFNYLAYWNDSEVMLHNTFDKVRNFIRYGTRTEIPILHYSEIPIMQDEPDLEHRRFGHILTVNKNSYGDAIIANVSLFNFISYKCLLSWGSLANNVILNKGSFFNLADLRILEIGNSAS